MRGEDLGVEDEENFPLPLDMWRKARDIGREINILYYWKHKIAESDSVS